MAEITLKNETTITFDRTDNWVEIARGAYRPRNSEHKNITASSRARLMALCANGERRTYGRFDEYTMKQTVEEATTPREPLIDTHGNALCERCHSAHIFYADSERYCQSCLLAIESEYDAKIAREEAQSLYNSDSGVDTDDYRAYMDKYAPELVTAAATTPAANTETVEAKPRPRLGDTLPCEHGNMRVMCTICSPVRTTNVLDVPASDEISKQDAQPEGALTDDEFKSLAKKAVHDLLDADEKAIFDGMTWDEYYRAKYGDPNALADEEILTLTYLCRQPNPATMEQIANEVSPTPDKVALVLLSLKNKGYAVETKGKHHEFSATDAGRAAIAQTAPVDGGSDEPLHVTIMSQLDAKVEDLTDEIERQQTEIRTLESKLAAATAIEQRLLSEWVAWHDSYEKVIGHYIPTEIVNQMKMLERILGYTPDREGRKPLAAREQSGAGEG